MGADIPKRPITITQTRTASSASTFVSLATPSPKQEFQTPILELPSGQPGHHEHHHEHLEQVQEQIEHAHTLWVRVRRYLQDPFSEFFGTFIFLLFAFGVCAQVSLSNGKKGDWVAVCLGWGVGIMLGAYTAASSGGHLNPAVTLTLVLLRTFPLRKLPVYAAAQTLGAFCAAAAVYGNYKSAIDQFEGYGVRTVPGFSNHSTAGIFATYPAPFMTTTGAFFSEFLASAVLMFCIFALQGAGGAGKLFPLTLMFVLIGISACFGWETSFAINPARDWGPRFFLSMVGYGKNVWTASHHYFWVPMLSPLLGCVFGGFLYDAFLNDGETPINYYWMGFDRFKPRRRSTANGLNIV